MKRECETCIKIKTPYCPTSIDCMSTDDMPYYQNRIMLLEENQKLKEAIDKIMNILENDYLYNDGDFESRKFQNDILSVLSEVNSKFGRL